MVSSEANIIERDSKKIGHEEKFEVRSLRFEVIPISEILYDNHKLKIVNLNALVVTKIKV